ncbi:Asp-tRNA(Asn)/Glu-tRNA(Gln) amidotransferase subunit GatA [bacterium]|nr:Asp-tRNA(Asn)/Glu-tRNA(Gln) amidotransferase subunit GatA [bacterium]
MSDLSSLIARGGLSAVQAAETAIERAQSNQTELNAFVSIDEKGALARAEALDSLGVDARAGMKLFGVPIAVKDNICVKGGRTTCGSQMLQRFVSPFDATVVRNLTDAGAVIIGKTNLDEFAMGSSTETSCFGPTRNPHDTSRSCGGSSGGSAAAVASFCAPCALGTDTGGSIRQPASFCGVLGLKPTYGLVSRYGLVAFAPSFDQIGPITRDVKDAALLLSVLAGHDPLDATSVDRPVEEYSRLLDDDVAEIKVGVIGEHIEAEGLTPAVKSTMNDALKALQDIGASISQVSLPSLEYAVAIYYVLGTAETSSNMLRYDGVRYGHRASGFSDLADMYRKTRGEGFSREVKRRIILGTFVLSMGYYDAYYERAQRARTLVMRDFDIAFEGVDVLVGPTSPQQAFMIGEKVDDPLLMYLSDIFTIPANLAGLPAVSLPFGKDADGLPIGVQLIGKPFDEARMLRLANALMKRNCSS